MGIDGLPVFIGSLVKVTTLFVSGSSIYLNSRSLYIHRFGLKVKFSVLRSPGTRIVYVVGKR